MASTSKETDENRQMEIPLTPISEEYFRSIFNRADINNDGSIDVVELHRMIKNDDIRDRPVPREIIKRIYSMSDTNKDGRLSFEEFTAMIKNPRLQSVFGNYMNKYVNFVIPRRNLGGSGIQRDGAYEEQYSCLPPPLCMIIISIIEFAFYLTDELCEKNSTKLATGPMAKRLIFDPTKRYEAWRFLTYMFVHIGHLHLVVNLIVQIFIGIPIEMVHGWWRILLIYLSGVLAGSLGTSITDPTAKLAGASGGVYSLITAHIASIIMNWREMTFPAVQLMIFLLITVVDVGSSIYNRYVQNIDEHIGYAAHFAGAVAGLLVGINVLRNLQVTKKEHVLWWISLITFSVLIAIAVCWNIFCPDYFPKTSY